MRGIRFVVRIRTANMAKNKFYVVWKGHQPGIYSSWAECQQQIHGFSGAEFKGFPNRPAAEAAFKAGAASKVLPGSSGPNLFAPNKIIANSLSVDAACSGNPGPMEYQGVTTVGKDQIFHQKFPLGTNNIGEFLAIIHALALLQKQDKTKLPIYTDSKIAIGWINKKKCKTTLVRNAKTEKLYEFIERGEAWLKANSWENPILKWDTKKWGEIPADFGRK